MSYKKYYEGGWQSGETGGTPITPEALNHMESGIGETYENLLNIQHITDSEHTVPSGADLNSYTTPGAYRIATAAIAGSLVNAPPYTSAGGRLVVSGMSGTTGVVQFVVFNTINHQMWVRIQSHIGTWGDWVKIFTQSDVPLVKELWSGSWSSGTITVPDTDKYTLFQISVSGIGTTVLAAKSGNYVRGIGGYSTAAPNIITYHFSGTISGNTWTYVACNAMRHTQESSHGELNDNLAVAGIRGLC